MSGIDLNNRVARIKLERKLRKQECMMARAEELRRAVLAQQRQIEMETEVQDVDFSE